MGLVLLVRGELLSGTSTFLAQKPLFLPTCSSHRGLGESILQKVPCGFQGDRTLAGTVPVLEEEKI